MPDLQQLEASTPSPEEVRPTPAEEAPRNYAAFKCCFYTPKRGDILGAFCLLFNGLTGEVLDNVFWVTRLNEPIPLDINTGWRELNKLIPEIGPYEKALGAKLLSILHENFSPQTRRELIQSHDNTEILQALSEHLRKNFERVALYFLEFDIALERLERQNLVEAGVLLDNDDTAAPAAGDTEVKETKTFMGTLVQCLPVIDPVKGKPVSELEPGDLVEVKIQGAFGASSLIRQYLSSTHQEALFPVESVQRKDDDKVFVFLTINEEIKGLVTVTKDLRLRTIRIGEGKKKLPSVRVDTLVFLGTLAIAGLVIFWVVQYLVF